MGITGSVQLEGRDADVVLGHSSLSTLQAVIVARDPHLCERFRDFLRHCPGVEVVSDAITAQEAIAVLKRHRPSLVLLDVRVAPGGCRLFPTGDGLPQVVLLISEDDDARGLIDARGISCLSLQCTREDCMRVIGSLDRPTEGAGAVDVGPIVRSLAGRPAVAADRVALRSGLDYLLLETIDIDWVRCESGRGTVVHAGTRMYVVSETLGGFWSRLKRGHRFAYLDETTIVNVDQVREYKVRPGCPAIVILHDGTELPVVRRFIKRLFAKLGIYKRSSRCNTI
jgi:DNA-binding LytR/AlgR family response regulator